MSLQEYVRGEPGTYPHVYTSRIEFGSGQVLYELRVGGSLVDTAYTEEEANEQWKVRFQHEVQNEYNKAERQRVRAIEAYVDEFGHEPPWL